MNSCRAFTEHVGRGFSYIRGSVVFVLLAFSPLWYPTSPAVACNGGEAGCDGYVSGLKVVLVSDAVAQAAQIRKAANRDTIAIVYPFDNMNSSGLVGLIASMSNEYMGAKIGHIGIVAHGRPGEIEIGKGSTLNLASLRSERLQWEQLRSLLTKDACIDIYACSVAAGKEGKIFIEELSTLTGTAVFAGEDLIGNASGATLALSYHSGAMVMADDLFSIQRLGVIQGLLLPADGPDLTLEQQIERVKKFAEEKATYLTANQVAQAAYGAGFRGGNLVIAVAVAGGESSFRLDAEVDNATEHSCGLWQINVDVHTRYSVSQLLSSASYNATAAYNIFSDASGWTPWSAFKNGGYEIWLSTARSGAQGVDSTVIRAVNDRVECLYNGVNVRSTAGGALTRAVNAGATGTVLEGPVVSPVGAGTYDHIWWKINWDDGGGDGWVAEEFLARTDAAPANVTLTLYVHNGSSSGPLLIGARVTGYDAGGTTFDKTTVSGGYVTIIGSPGLWHFSANMSGYSDSTWDQNITETGERHAYLIPLADTQPPTVNISSPTNGQVFIVSSIMVSGTATDAGGSGLAGIMVNNNTNGSAEYQPVSGDSAQYAIPIMLAPGTNAIWAVAFDQQGNSSTYETVTVTYNPPTRIISLGGNLAFGSVTVGSNVQRTLTISNTGNSVLTVGGIMYPSGFSGSWSGTILAGGYQDVTVTFSPTSATSYGGIATVSSDKTSGTDTISCSGSGEYESEGEVVEGEGEPLEGEPVEGETVIGAVRTITGRVAVINVTPPEGTAVWGVAENTIPGGLQVVNITGSYGAWDSINRRISWWAMGDSPNTLSYEVRGPNGSYVISGEVSFDGPTEPITGDGTFIIDDAGCNYDTDCDDDNVCTEDSCDPATGECVHAPICSVPHPADLSVNFRMVMSEAIAYLAGWQQGSNPMAYAIRAAYIWQNGEQYTYDAEQAPPLCWVLAP